MGFGTRLKDLLKEKNMTIKELSEKTGISINTLYSITKRDTRLPNYESIIKIAQVLDVPEAALLPEEHLEYTKMRDDIGSTFDILKLQEENHRQALSGLCQYLNSLALLKLIDQALDMLQDDTNHSLVNEIASSKQLIPFLNILKNADTDKHNSTTNN